jgi:uncharacterized membrane protein YbhN (UPF0104 family)
MDFSRPRSYLPYVLSAAAMLVFGVYLYRNADRYRQLLDLSVGSVLSLLGLALMFALVNGLASYVFYRGLRVPLTLNEGVGLAAVNTLANQLPFAGGLVARGIYLKRRHGLAYTRFLSATLALYVCFVAANGAVGIGVLTYWTLDGSVAVPPLLILGFSVMALSIVSLWLSIDAVSIPGKLGQRLVQLMDGWQTLRHDLHLVGKLVGLQVVMTLMFALRFWLAFRALSQDVTFTQCLLFSAATVLTRLVNISPGGLGVREGIVAGIAFLLGFEADVSAVAVGIDRLAATSVIGVLGTIYALVLGNKATSTE